MACCRCWRSRSSGDVALVYADRADALGNLWYRKTARNFNPMMATAATLTIAEVREIVPVGGIEGESIHTPTSTSTCW